MVARLGNIPQEEHQRKPAEPPPWRDPGSCSRPPTCTCQQGLQTRSQHNVQSQHPNLSRSGEVKELTEHARLLGVNVTNGSLLVVTVELQLVILGRLNGSILGKAADDGNGFVELGFDRHVGIEM